MSGPQQPDPGQFLRPMVDQIVKEYTLPIRKSYSLSASLAAWVSIACLMLSTVFYVIAFSTIGWGYVESIEEDGVVFSTTKIGLWQECHSLYGCKFVSSSDTTSAFQATQAFATLGFLTILASLALVILYLHVVRQKQPIIALALFGCRVASVIFLLLTFSIFSARWTEPRYNTPNYNTSTSFSFDLTITTFVFELIGAIFMAIDTFGITGRDDDTAAHDQVNQLAPGQSHIYDYPQNEYDDRFAREQTTEMNNAHQHAASLYDDREQQHGQYPMDIHEEQRYANQEIPKVGHGQGQESRDYPSRRSKHKNTYDNSGFDNIENIPEGKQMTLESSSQRQSGGPAAPKRDKKHHRHQQGQGHHVTHDKNQYGGKQYQDGSVESAQVKKKQSDGPNNDRSDRRVHYNDDKQYANKHNAQKEREGYEEMNFNQTGASGGAQEISGEMHY